MSETVVKVEQVVIGSDGTVYRSENVKRRLAYQKSVGNPVWSRLAIAKVEDKPDAIPNPPHLDRGTADT